MNPFAATGLLDQAVAGKQVLVLNHTWDAARASFEVLANQAPQGVRLRRANGLLSVETPGGGRIFFRSAKQSHRGFSEFRGRPLDLVFVDGEAADAAVRNYSDLRAALTPGSGEIVRA